MSVKVKRGLGLLVVTVIAWIAVYALNAIDAQGSAVDVVQELLVLGLYLVMVGSFITGLVLVAWGLLNE